MRHAIKLMLTIMLFIICTTSYAQGATRLYYENFDDQAIGTPFLPYEMAGSDRSITLGEYTYQTGRGGTGYCFSSGTVRDPYIEWWPMNGTSSGITDEFYVSYWMRFPSYTYSVSDENFKIFYPHWGDGALEVRLTSGGSGQINAYKNGSVPGNCSTYKSFTGMPNGTSWHRIEAYVKFSTGAVKVWYDRPVGNWTDGSYLLVNYTMSGGWSGGMTWISFPAWDSDNANMNFTWSLDDVEVWNGMPDASTPPTPADTTAPARPSGVTATIIQ